MSVVFMLKMAGKKSSVGRMSNVAIVISCSLTMSMLTGKLRSYIGWYTTICRKLIAS